MQQSIFYNFQAAFQNDTDQPKIGAFSAFANFDAPIHDAKEDLEMKCSSNKTRENCSSPKCKAIESKYLPADLLSSDSDGETEATCHSPRGCGVSTYTANMFQSDSSGESKESRFSN